MANGLLTLDELKNLADSRKIDTVLVCFPDMQGRLMGKRFHVSHFLKTSHKETHCCNYLLATDLEMSTLDIYKSTSWESGYGDYTLKPDLNTLRCVPWLEGTAMVIGDMFDHHTHKEVPHSPRAMLRKQLKRLESMGMSAYMGNELEFFMFDQTYEDARAGNYRSLKTSSHYNEDYHIFQTTKEEGVMRAIRNGIYGAGIMIENTKGEAYAGQGEVNVLYSDALTMADNHVIIKNCCREIAWQHGKAITFMAKWDDQAVGSSSHMHQSLWSIDGKESLFYDTGQKSGMSVLMRQYLAGVLHHAEEMTYFMAPYVNSYKRFKKSTFAPTKIVWSKDNRTASFRICGENSKAIRVECRIAGSDVNPYLSMAAQIAAGIDGIENKRTLEPEFKGNAYLGAVREIPKTIGKAAHLLRNSNMLRQAMGDDVVDHYSTAAEWELECHEAHVTDTELKRCFEQV